MNRVSVSGSNGAESNGPCVREMTVAHLSESKDADYVEVVFLDSARFYRLQRSNPLFEESYRLLKAAAKEAGVLKIRTASLDNDIIEEVLAV